MDGLSRTDARAVEQALIVSYGLGKNGGTLLNRINSIALSIQLTRNSFSVGMKYCDRSGCTEMVVQRKRLKPGNVLLLGTASGMAYLHYVGRHPEYGDSQPKA
jgi:hypothetical protein